MNPRPTAWKAVTLPIELLPHTQTKYQRQKAATEYTTLSTKKKTPRPNNTTSKHYRPHNHIKQNTDLIKKRLTGTTKRARTVSPKKIKWGGEDSNLRRCSPTDLQSAPFGHSGTSPYKPPAGIEPATSSLQVRRSTI